MIPLIKRYLLFIGLAAAIATFSPGYQRGVLVGNMPIKDTYGLACSQEFSDRLYTVSEDKVVVINKLTGDVASTLSLDNVHVNAWSDITAGPCKHKIIEECVYLLEKTDRNSLQVVWFPVSENLDSVLKIRQRHSINIHLNSSFAKSSLFITVDARANIGILSTADDGFFYSFELASSEWAGDQMAEMKAQFQHNLTVRLFSWNQQVGKVIVQDDVGDKYAFSAHHLAEPLGFTLGRKPHHVKLRLSGGDDTKSLCIDSSTDTIYSLVMGEHIGLYRFTPVNDGYQADQSRQAECEDKNTHCTKWASNGMCLKRRSYMIEYCPKACDKCREHARTQGMPKCIDNNHLCTVWAGQGYCVSSSSRGYMVQYCKKSCQMCSASNSTAMCRDEHSYCSGWSQAGRCNSRPDYMLKHCKASCGKCPTTSINKEFQRDEATNSIQSASCRDLSEYCSSWAKEGKCDSRRDYMFTNCPNSCGLCGQKDEEVKVEENCEDLSKYCLVWEAQGYCKTKTKYMKRNCPAACKKCRSNLRPEQTSECKDRHDFCPTWAKYMLCSMKAGYMKMACRKSCGECQGNKYNEESNRILQPKTTTTKAPVRTTKNTQSAASCDDMNSRCPQWASGGYCKRRPSYMNTYCKKSCNVCDTTAIKPTTERPTTITTTIIKPGCTDSRAYCKVWSAAGMCRKNAERMKTLCPLSCNRCELRTTAPQPTKTSSKYRCADANSLCSVWKAAGYCETRQLYMKATCSKTCGYCAQQQEEKCKDKNNFCRSWAQMDRCHAFRGYMRINCAKSCNFCETLEREARVVATCTDSTKYCKRWATNGYCDIRKDFMEVKCRKSCNMCK